MRIWPLINLLWHAGKQCVRSTSKYEDQLTNFFLSSNVHDHIHLGVNPTHGKFLLIYWSAVSFRDPSYLFIETSYCLSHKPINDRPNYPITRALTPATLASSTITLPKPAPFLFLTLWSDPSAWTFTSGRCCCSPWHQESVDECTTLAVLKLRRCWVSISTSRYS